MTTKPLNPAFAILFGEDVRDENYLELIENVFDKMKKPVQLANDGGKHLQYNIVSKLYTIHKHDKQVYSTLDWVRAIEKYWREDWKEFRRK
jgi:hypothetical protein